MSRKGPGSNRFRAPFRVMKNCYRNIRPGPVPRPRTYDSGVIDQVGPYILIKLIGEGGMGEVWRAENEDTGREVAIKLLAKHALTDVELQERFR